jgi:formylglycine-generating enzyme
MRIALLVLAGLAACSQSAQPSVDRALEAGRDVRLPGDAASPDRARSDRAAADLPRVDQSAGACPTLMVKVDGKFCIDQYEAALEEQSASGAWAAASPYLTVGTRTVRAVPAAGIVPQGYVGGDQAAKACAASGKRLCTSTEWLSACRGPTQTTYPYGNTHQAGACNDAYSGSPVVNFFGTSQGVWDAVHMNDPGINQQAGTVAKGGAFSKCVSAWGAYDLHGNLHEWVDDAAGTFRGGFYADGSINGAGCLYATTAHDFTYHDYSTGFRCCRDL